MARTDPGVDAYIDALPDWQQTICRELREVVLAVSDVVVMIALIVGVDVLFLSEDVWARLLVNLGIVAAFAILYFKVRTGPR